MEVSTDYHYPDSVTYAHPNSVSKWQISRYGDFLTGIKLKGDIDIIKVELVISKYRIPLRWEMKDSIAYINLNVPILAFQWIIFDLHVVTKGGPPMMSGMYERHPNETRKWLVQTPLDFQVQETRMRMAASDVVELI